MGSAWPDLPRARAQAADCLTHKNRITSRVHISRLAVRTVRLG